MLQQFKSNENIKTASFREQVVITANKKEQTERGFSAPSTSLWQAPTENAAKNVPRCPWQISRQHHTRHMQRCLSSIHKQRLFSKKLKASSNHHMTHHLSCIIEKKTVNSSSPEYTVTHNYDTKKTDAPCSHAYSLKCFRQSGHWQPNEELNQCQHGGFLSITHLELCDARKAFSFLMLCSTELLPHNQYVESSGYK